MAQSLLLGLGGTGSRVVNYVAADLRKKRIKINDGHISCAVLDTNANDQKKLKTNNTGIPVIPTGKKRKIEEYIQRYKAEDIPAWLPLSKTFLKETTIDGASQMRPKSRIAFLDVTLANELHELEKVIDKLFDYQEPSKIRVMIISSLAGGTGSGMFIQVALWLRQFFAKHACEVTIRGIFVLPDVFIRTVEDIRKDDREKKSLYANAYGAIRELNTITKIMTKDYTPPLPVRIDHLFDSTKDANSGQPVCDYSFFIDDVSEDGGVLTDLAGYEEAVARLVYMQLYAPMHDDLYSEEDNLFKRFQLSSEPLYGSCGAAKALYPTADIVRYCSLRAAQDSLSDGWRRIDDEIALKLAREKELEQSGKVIQRRIDPDHEFIRLFDAKTSLSISEAGRDHLFVNIAHDVLVEKRSSGPDGEIIVTYRDKTEDFLAALEEQVVGTIDTEFGETFNGIRLGEKWVTSDKDNTLEALRPLPEKKQKAVKTFLDDMDASVHEMAETLCSRICPSYFDDANCNTEGSVMHFLSKPGEHGDRVYVHPIALRYLLYKLKAKFDELQESVVLEELRASAEQGHGSGQKKIVFDNVKTKATEDTPKEYLESKKFSQNPQTFIRTFKEKFSQHINGQAALCRKYAIELLEYCLSELLEQKIEKLIEPAEKFFERLEVVSRTLQSDIAENIKRNSEVTSKMIFVCASQAEKEELYQSLRLSTWRSDEAINRSVAESIYGKYCYSEFPNAERNREIGEVDVNTYFFVDMVRHFEQLIMKSHKADVDLDIYSAVCKSSDIAYKKAQEKLSSEEDPAERLLDVDLDADGDEIPVDPTTERHEEAMRDLIDQLRNLSAPFLIARYAAGDMNEHLEPEDSDGSMELEMDNNEVLTKRKTFWGFHPVVAQKCGNLGGLLGINVASQENTAYSKNELDCYRAVYGISAAQVDKFNELNGGDYYKNYSEIVRTMVRETAAGHEDILLQTPHLDKTWHLFLPYVSAEKQLEEESRFNRLFWLALAYGMITINKRGKFQILRKKKTKTGESYEKNELLRLHGETIDRLDIDKLLAALKIDAFFLYDAAELEDRYTEECAKTTYERTIFLSGFRLMEYVEGEEGEEGAEETVGTEEAASGTVTVGGLATAQDINAVTMLVRYSTSPDYNDDTAMALVRTLETLLFGLAKNKYEKNETAKIRRAGFELCGRIYKASAMKSKNIDLFDDWRREWSKPKIED